jgi:hypothetical protein
MQREENSLGVVRFPNPWTKTTADGSVVAFADPNGFEVRKHIGPPARLIFAMKGSLPGGPARSLYADQFYQVTLDGQMSVTMATRDEWEHAEPLPITRERVPANKSGPSSAPAKHDEGISYRDKVFAKGGMFWGRPAAITSPNGRWLALFSFSSSAKPSVSWSPLDGGMPDEPRPGEIIVEVYDASSGRQVQSGRSRYDSSPSILFGQAFWAGDTYLIVPLDPVNWSSTGGPACFLANLSND